MNGTFISMLHNFIMVSNTLLLSLKIWKGVQDSVWQLGMLE